MAFKKIFLKKFEKILNGFANYSKLAQIARIEFRWIWRKRIIKKEGDGEQLRHENVCMKLVS